MKSSLIGALFGFASVLGLASPADAMTHEELREYVKNDVGLKLIVGDKGEISISFSDSESTIKVYLFDNKGKTITNASSATEIDQIRVETTIPYGFETTQGSRATLKELFNKEFIYKLYTPSDEHMVCQMCVLELTAANDAYIKEIVQNYLKESINLIIEIEKRTKK